MTGTTRRRVTTLATAVILSSVTISGMPAAGATPTPTATPVPTAAVAPPSIGRVVTLRGEVGPSIFEIRVLRKTNKARRQSRRCGSTWMRATGPVRWNPTLARTAHNHSADMATRNYFSHYAPGNVSPFQRIRTAGYRYRAAGENIAAGRSLAKPRDVVRAWLNSPGHCKVIMNPKYRDLGVGRVEGAGKWTVYWTQNFGTR